MRQSHRRPDGIRRGFAAALVTMFTLAAIPAAATTATAPATATASRPAAKTAAKASPKTARAPGASKISPGPKASGATTSARTAPRTLDPVHIEGELDVPEVLFITARDQRRILGFQHRRYLHGSRELASRTPLPSHLIVDHETPAPPPEAPR